MLSKITYQGKTYPSEKAMCKALNYSYGLYWNRKKAGMTLDEIFNIPVNKGNQVTYQGKIYPSESAMCNALNFNYDLYQRRKGKGMTLDEIFNTPINKGNEITYQGKTYPNEKAMCKALNFAYSTYQKRKSKGMTLDEIFSMPTNYNFKCTYQGVIYPSEKAMCEAIGFNYKLYNRRKQKGWELEKILNTPIGPTKGKKSVDHLGNIFKTETDMCRYYDMPLIVYKTRLRKKWSIKNALTIPINSIHKNHISCEDHLGNKFNSITKMCEKYNIDRTTYVLRIKNNWTIEEALTLPINMYIGEYRVKQSLEKYNISYIHNKTIKTIFKKLNFNIDWNEFLTELQLTLSADNINWSKSKIEKLRPDFVLYRDKDNKITGVIEFDGEQHFNFVEYFFKVIENFQRRSDADFVKNSLWEHLEIPMLRIRYDQVDLIDEMILDFINNPQKYITNHNTYLTEVEYWEELKETFKELDNDDLGYAM